jgi:hypothetical protein
MELGLADYGRLITPIAEKLLSHTMAFYAQDDVKLKSNLTVNLGLRYSIDTPRTSAQNTTSNFSPTAIDPKNGMPGALVFAPNCHCNTAWANTYYKAFQPRVGFAFNPAIDKQRTVLRGGVAVFFAPLQYADFGDSMNQGFVNNYGAGGNGYDPIFNLANGFPVLPKLPNLDPGQSDSGNAASPWQMEDIEPSFGRPGMVTNWNLQLQRQMAENLVLSVGYLGASGQNLSSFLLQPNNIQSKYLSMGDTLSSYNLAAAGIASPYPGFNGTVGQALRPFPQYDNLTTPSDIENVGHSSYDALAINLQQRSRFGLTFDVAYTWSKTITDADSAIGGINGGVWNLTQDQGNLKSAKALSTQDVPSNFVVNYLYELPIGKGKKFLGGSNAVANAVVGGWTIGGVQRYVSAPPNSFACAGGLTVQGSAYNDCMQMTLLPGTSLKSKVSKPNPWELLNNPSMAGPDPTQDSVFNGLKRVDNAAYSTLQGSPALFDQNNESNRNGGAFHFGNLSRTSGAARVFPFMNEDLVLIKNTRIYGAKFGFQFKAEALNVFNRHIFAQVDTNPYNNDFGVPESAVGGQTDSMRRLQLTGRITF